MTSVTDSELDQLRSFITAQLPAYLADLERLVNIDCGTYNKKGVDEVGSWFRAQMESMGADVTVDHNADLGDTVVCGLEGEGGGDHALLIGHLDTVFDDGTAAERPFSTANGRAYGPGVNDMKAGLLTGLYAVRALQAMGPLPFARVTYLANPDEEIGSPASTPVIREMAEHVDVCFVLESARDNGDIVSARKGIADFIVQIEGRAAHAGVEPEKGRSAILEAAHKTLALTALNGRWPGVTVNVGTVSGGTRPNVIAERCELEIDLRAPTRADMETAEAEITAIAMSNTVPEVVTTVTRRHWWWPMEKGDATAALALSAQSLAARLGFELHDAATGGASDANTTSGMGVPTLDGLGPVGGADHAPGEYTEIDSIVPRTVLLAALMLTASREGPRRT
ncbi:MAG TPA: M20 family metallopeptidase [Candidatus Limnocylindrales bacterium]|jgi:glutamate carboxypeptidase